MGTKRKSRGSSRNASKGDVTYSENSRFAPDERFDDSQDEFEAGRDHILLEEAPEAKRRRKLREEEGFFEQSDAEIHPYESDEDEDDFDEDEESDGADYEDEEPKQASKRLRGRKALSPTSDDENPQEKEDFISGWGSKKENYYDADMIETEADALEEEQEAKKIQLKRLQAMDEADFGFDESEWATTEQEESAKNKENGAITEILPELQISDDMSKEDRLKILNQRYPEFEPLSKDFVDLQSIYQELASTAQSKDDNTTADQPSIPMLKFRVLSAYLGVISMYFVLLTSTAKDHSLALAPAQLREHPVMEALINTRKQWEQVRNLQPQTPESDFDSDSEPGPEEPIPIEKPKPAKPQEKSTKPKKTKTQKALDEAASLSAQRRAARMQQTEKGLAELSKLLDAEHHSKKTKSQPTTALIQNDSDSDFGDETELTAHELAEKAKKRKSLRFYTSQIAQKANKRSAAGRDAGGDADLPYRERLKDRQARLNAEAEKRGRKELTERERLGGESDEEDQRVGRELRDQRVPEAEGEEDYYDLVKGRSEAKKEGKRKLAEMQREAEREGGYVEEVAEIGPDGKRKITYAIEKNKGLAPKRKKDVRNPRVKKRKKFEQKTKRLGSMRQVYKGGEGRGGYGGELTGIKKNLVKSVKL